MNSYVPHEIAVEGTFMLILATAPFIKPFNPSLANIYLAVEIISL